MVLPAGSSGGVWGEAAGQKEVPRATVLFAQPKATYKEYQGYYTAETPWQKVLKSYFASSQPMGPLTHSVLVNLALALNAYV